MQYSCFAFFELLLHLQLISKCTGILLNSHVFPLFFLWNEYRTLLTCFGLSFQSYKDLTGTSWTLVYFISFYLITVLLLLNLVSYILPLHYLSSLLLYDSQRQHNGYGPSSPTNRENVVQKQDEGNFFFFFFFSFSPTKIDRLS